MTRRVNLALQGGGAHGAFTWGVLDVLLEDEEIEIAAITGTSAGALNGAALKAGWHRSGRQGAIEALNRLWRRVGAVGDIRLGAWMAGFAPATAAISDGIAASPTYALAEMTSNVFSPYAYGPFYRNPLKPIVDGFDYDRVCAESEPRFHVCATNVRTGRARVFSGAEICTEAILASACLPTVFQAVEMDDPGTGRREAYWDGGYSGNPALFPLYDKALPDDIVIVALNPLEREEVPKSPQEIDNRVNEVSFNSALLHDLRAIRFVKRLIREGRIATGEMKNVLVHFISDDELMRQLSVATKLMPNPVLINRLRRAGRAAAENFLARHRDDLGRRDSTDLDVLFG